MKMKITLHGVAYEVDVEILDEGEGFYSGGSVPQMPRVIPTVPVPANITSPTLQYRPPSAVPAEVTDKQILSPVGGIVVEIKLRVGDTVKKGTEILVLEAMKMHTSIAAYADGKIKSIPVAAGDTVRESQVLVVFE